jgi:hypothetical protein
MPRGIKYVEEYEYEWRCKSDHFDRVEHRDYGPARVGLTDSCAVYFRATIQHDCGHPKCPEKGQLEACTYREDGPSHDDVFVMYDAYEPSQYYKALNQILRARLQ